jgi:prevent-host-death family protein
VPDSRLAGTGLWYIIHSMIDTPQTITIPATELNLRAGNILRLVAVDRQHVIIERNGYPIAVMIPIHDYENALRHKK